MFTGLIKEVGEIKNIVTNREGKIFTIAAPALLPEIGIHDSIATNGVCLTATEVKKNEFSVQAVHTTLKKTTLGGLKLNERVNLELALRLSDRLGGHLVQGHVNGVGMIHSLQKIGKNYEIWLKVPATLTKYMVLEGSVTIDGISLTIAEVKPQKIMVTVIPYTLDHTNLKFKKVGDKVNLEADCLMKYVESLMKHNKKGK
ncbi:MAG: riboflavin synthase [Bacteriovoracaceae bacterium]